MRPESVQDASLSKKVENLDFDDRMIVFNGFWGTDRHKKDRFEALKYLRRQF